MRKIICDRCEGDLTGEAFVGAVAVMQKRTINGELLGENTYDKMDFCDECIKEIEQAISKKETPISIMSDSTENKESKQKKEPKSNIDMGKVMALRDAGWKVKDIADEMGKTPHDISQAIYKHKKTNGENDGEQNRSAN